VPEGTEFTVTVTQACFQEATSPISDINIPDFTFKVKIGAPETRTILNENSTSNPTRVRNQVVLVKRSINANVWSSLCLPFAMTTDQLNTAFGENSWQIAEFDKAVSTEESGEIVDIDLQFNSVNAITANKPCIIKLTNEVTSFEVAGVSYNGGNPSYQNSDGDYFNATYAAGTSIPDLALFLSEGKLWYSKGKNKTKAYRGWFELFDVITSVENGATVRASLSIGDETTDITNVIREINDDEYYDLQGRRVINPSKGFYIQNGKKIFVK
jgi:hypothetical protein